MGKKKLKGNKDAIGDPNKPRLSLIPKEALWALGSALTTGEARYGAQNWRGGIPLSVLCDAAMRHITQFIDGEDMDEQSKTHHLGCAMANLSFAISLHAKMPSCDDRYKKKGKKK
jgi:hypothetical protein